MLYRWGYKQPHNVGCGWILYFSVMIVYGWWGSQMGMASRRWLTQWVQWEFYRWKIVLWGYSMWGLYSGGLLEDVAKWNCMHSAEFYEYVQTQHVHRNPDVSVQFRPEIQWESFCNFTHRFNVCFVFLDFLLNPYTLNILYVRFFFHWTFYLLSTLKQTLKTVWYFSWELANMQRWSF